MTHTGMEDKITTATVHGMLSMLSENSWIYNFQLTRFFIDSVWEKIPPEWVSPLLELSYQELNDLPYDLKKDDWPCKFKRFLKDAKEFSLPRTQSQAIKPCDIDNTLKRGMNPKKVHEVSYMPSIVADVCKKASCDTVIDVGSGLGYLGQVLRKNFGHRVIGLESVDTRSHGADTRISKQGLDKIHIESHIFELLDSPYSMSAFSELLKQLKTSQQDNLQTACQTNVCDSDTRCNNSHNNMDERTEKCMLKDGNCKAHPPNTSSDIRTDSNVCMVGLHCCGDLTPAMLKYFSKLSDLQSLVCVSCCYHSMKTGDDGNFINFPMSAAVSGLLSSTQESSPDFKLNVFAMRLAAQETRARWRNQIAEDHEYHLKNVAYRGIVELGLSSQNTNLHKLRRKVARKSHFKSFKTYLDAIFERSSLEGSSVSLCEDQDRMYKMMLKLHDENEKYFPFIEAVTALQVILQPVLESLVICDRVLFLKESGLEHVEVVPIFDDLISPRNMAIIATKAD